MEKWQRRDLINFAMRQCSERRIDYSCRLFPTERKEQLMLSTRTALRIALTLCLSTALTAVSIAAGASAPNMAVLQHWKLGGAGGGDYITVDAKGRLFISRSTRVNIESDPGQMLVIDAQKLTVKSTWPLPGCNSPSGLAIDSKHRRLFSVCDGKVMAVTDAVNGKQVALVPIGEHPDAAGYDQKRGLVYSSNGEGTWSVVGQDSADRYSLVQSLPTQRGTRTMALDAATGKVYLVTSDFGPAPPATAEQPHPRPAMVPDSFVVLV